MFWTIATIAAALLGGLLGWNIGGHPTAFAFTLAGALAVFGVHDLRKHKHSLLAGSLLAGIAGWYLGEASFTVAMLATVLAFLIQLIVWEFFLKKSMLMPVVLTGTFIAWFVGWNFVNPVTGLVFALLAFLAQIGIDDYYLQRKHAVRRNFPIIGWCRYGFEMIGDELRQYWFMSDTEELPYNRETRRFIYRSAKGINNNLGFGTSRNYRAVGEIHILPKMFPTSERIERGNRLPPLVIGKKRRKPYVCPWPINISGMSWGALSEEAVMALSSGAKLANIHILTGEGGLTPFHQKGVVKRLTRKQMFDFNLAKLAYYASFGFRAKPVMPEPEVVGGGRIILQIGPAKFGFRRMVKDAFRTIGVDFAPNRLDLSDLSRLARAYYLNGLDSETIEKLAREDELAVLDFDKLKRLADDDQIVAIELKLAQGAKPGQGGKLPKEKITEKIAAWRGIPMGKDCYSPNAWDEFSDVPSMFKFIKMLQDLVGKPVGIKIVVGQDEELVQIAGLMQESGEGPDFITIDGGEGGTGAAPVDLADTVGLPILHAIPEVDNIFRAHGVRDDVVLIASGQIAKASDVAIAIALGADAVNIGRGNMIAEGCIMAKRCHTNHCPVGVATQDPRLRRGLDPQDKYVKVANYNMVLQRGLLMILKSVGVKHPWELTRHHLKVVTSPMVEQYMDEIHPYPDDSNGKRNPLLGVLPPEDREHNDRFGPKLIQIEGLNARR